MLAQLDLNKIQKQGLPDYTGGQSVGEIISNILPYIFGAAGIALLIFLVLGGLQMMTSRGDPKAMQGAQAKITNALIGFGIIFLAFALVRVVGQALGVAVFSEIFK